MKISKLAFVVMAVMSNILVAQNATAGENTEFAYISSITARDRGSHNVFLHGTTFQNFDGCVYSDRSVLIDSDGENKALLAALLTAMANGFKVSLRVTTCVPLQEGSNLTGPKLVKVKVYVPEPE